MTTYLQDWKLKLSKLKTVLAAFHLNMEAKRELSVKYERQPMPFLPEPKYLKVIIEQVANVSPTTGVTT